MENNVILLPVTETLVSHEVRSVHAYANYITILSNSANSEIGIGIGDMTPVLLAAGLQYELPQGDSFNKILLYNQTAVTTTVSLILSNGKVIDNRFTVSSEIAVRDVTNSISSPAAMAIGTATAVPLAPVVGQREIHVQNTGSYSVWYGDINVNPSAFRGIEIPAGATYIINTSATVYFRAAGSASSISLNVFKTV